jgi:hypothetical protein
VKCTVFFHLSFIARTSGGTAVPYDFCYPSWQEGGSWQARLEPIVFHKAHLPTNLEARGRNKRIWTAITILSQTLATYYASTANSFRRISLNDSTPFCRYVQDTASMTPPSVEYKRDRTNDQVSNNLSTSKIDSSSCLSASLLLLLCSSA